MNVQSRLRLRTGRMIPVIGLGTWQLTNRTAGTVVEALRMGYRMIDTSGDYGTQPGIREAMRRSAVPREDLYLVTKVEEDEDAYEGVVDDLRELGTEYADLMLIHRPPSRGAGVELWRGLIRAKKEGLTRDIGVSNYSIEQMEELAQATGEMPVVNQIEWSPFGYSKEMYDWCRRNEVVIQAYSLLTRAKRLDDDALDEIADRHHKTPAQVLIRWNLQHGTIPIPKANHVEHLRENLDVFDFKLTDMDDAVLDGLNEHYSALGSLPYVDASLPRELMFRERLEEPEDSV